MTPLLKSQANPFNYIYSDQLRLTRTQGVLREGLGGAISYAISITSMCFFSIRQP